MMSMLRASPATVTLYVAPLWPAGHLPHEGGDQSLRPLRLNLRPSHGANIDARDLPPRGGDVRQDRGGREGTQP
jgi:hypothetical protein